jgi:hypothetical protein
MENHYTPEWSRFVGKVFYRDKDDPEDKGKWHKITLLEVKSFAHKCIRDGDYKAAVRWMRLLYDNGAKCWKQILIYAVEDIGKADLSVMDHLLLLKCAVKKRIKRLEMVYKEIEDGHTEWMCIALATTIASLAWKHRLTDNITIWIKGNLDKFPPITPEMWEMAKKEGEAAILDIKAKKLPPVKDKYFDKHTALGKKMERGLKHFLEVSSAIKNEALDQPDFTPPNW